MGQKVHPVGIRLGIVKDHNSIWYADSKNYSRQLIADMEVRQYIEKALEKNYSIDRIYELTRIDRWFLVKLKNQKLRTKMN